MWRSLIRARQVAYRSSKQDICAICFEEVDTDNLIEICTEGQHFFHKKCICRWLKTHNTCPSCRRELKDVEIAPCLEFDGPEVGDHSNRGLTTATFSNTVTSIVDKAFFNNKLTALHLPITLETVGRAAFYENPITSVVLSAPLMKDMDSFLGCAAITHLVILGTGKRKEERTGQTETKTKTVNLSACSRLTHVVCHRRLILKEVHRSVRIVRFSTDYSVRELNEFALYFASGGPLEVVNRMPDLSLQFGLKDTFEKNGADIWMNTFSLFNKKHAFFKDAFYKPLSRAMAKSANNFEQMVIDYGLYKVIADELDDGEAGDEAGDEANDEAGDEANDEADDEAGDEADDEDNDSGDSDEKDIFEGARKRIAERIEFKEAVLSFEKKQRAQSQARRVTGRVMTEEEATELETCVFTHVKEKGWLRQVEWPQPNRALHEGGNKGRPPDRTKNPHMDVSTRGEDRTAQKAWKTTLNRSEPNPKYSMQLGSYPTSVIGAIARDAAVRELHKEAETAERQKKVENDVNEVMEQALDVCKKDT